MCPIIQVFTQPVDIHYPAGLANALHFSIQMADKQYSLHQGYPLLFGQGTVGEDNSIQPANLLRPALSETEDGYVISADLVEESTQRILSRIGWLTRDFISFSPCPPVPGNENSLSIPQAIAETALIHWNPLHSVSVQVKDTLHPQELDRVRAAVTYSDGSVHEKRIHWHREQVDFSTPGRYPITGEVVCPTFPFPLTKNTGDPVLMEWEGAWYFIYTNDAVNDIGLYLRRAQTPQALFTPNAYEEVLLLDQNPKKHLIQTFWAPEFHQIGGRLYILFAVSGEAWGPRCHLMRLKEGQDLFCPHSWEDPRPVLRQDGSPLCDGGISLDMTHMEAGGVHYMVWSSRYRCMQPGDSGSMLSIAQIDPATPWQLASEPVLLTRPLLGFENMAGTINNEGPYAMKQGGNIYLLYSGGAANGYTYDLGCLMARDTDVLTDPTVWQKSQTAVLHFLSIPGIYGPGHHSFFTLDGDTYIAFHGETDVDSHIRCTGIHRVHIDAKGRPRFDLSAQRDLTPGLEKVSATLIIA